MKSERRSGLWTGFLAQALPQILILTGFALAAGLLFNANNPDGLLLEWLPWATHDGPYR